MLQLRVMGEAVLQAPQGRLTPAASRVFALGLVLVLDREHAWERDELAGLLWPDAPLMSARHNLRQALYRLRQLGLPVHATGERVAVSPGAVIRSDEPTLNEPIHLLADAILTGTRRIGPFLGGYDPTFSPELREWVERQRTRAHARLRILLVQCLEQVRSCARWSAVERLCDVLLEIDPLNEKATLARVEVALMTGDQVGARQMLEEYKAEVGEVSEELAVPAALIRTRVSENLRGTHTQSRERLARLVGRDDELQTCYRFLSAAKAGKVKALTITGEAGIGKSRLIDECVQIARTVGFATATLRCDARDSPRPYSVLARLIGELLQLPGALAVSPEHMNLLSAISSAGSASLPDIKDIQAITNALSELLTNLSDEAPLLIALDDADYIDRPSLQTIGAASADISADVVAYVLTTLSVRFIAHPLVPGHDTSVVVHLRPLSSDATLSLVRNHLGSDAPAESVAWVAERSVGNPRHVGVLASHWEVTRTLSTPPSLRDTVRAAFALQSSTAIRLLHLLSAARFCRNVSCLEALSGHTPAELYTSLSELESARLIEVHSSNLTVANPIVAEVASTYHGEAADAVVHRLIARHLESDHETTDLHEIAWERAFHWMTAGDVERATAAVETTLRDLWSAGLRHESAQLAVTVASKCTTSRQRQRIVHRILAALDGGAQWADLLSLSRQLTPSGDDQVKDELTYLSRMFAEYRETGDAETAIRGMRPYILKEEISPTIRIQAADYGLRLADIHIDTEAIDQFYEAVRPFLFADSASAWSALVCQTVFHSSRGQLTIAEDAATGLVELAASSADAVTITRALRFRALVRIRAGAHELARTDLESALAATQSLGSMILTAVSAGRLLELSMSDDDEVRAAHWLREMNDAYSRCSVDSVSMRARTILIARHHLAFTADALPAELRSKLDLRPFPMPRRERLDALAILILDAVRQGDERRVRRMTRTLETLWCELEPDNGVDYPACALVLGTSVRDSERAKHLLDEHLTRRREPTPLPRGAAKILPAGMLRA